MTDTRGASERGSGSCALVPLISSCTPARLKMDDLDHGMLSLVAALHRADLDELHDAEKGKGLPGARNNEQAAFDLYEQELAALDQLFADVASPSVSTPPFDRMGPSLPSWLRSSAERQRIVRWPSTCREEGLAATPEALRAAVARLRSRAPAPRSPIQPSPSSTLRGSPAPAHPPTPVPAQSPRADKSPPNPSNKSSAPSAATV